MKLLALAWWLFISTVAVWAAGEDQPQLPAINPGRSFSFVVLGDNRGDDSGNQPPAFLEVLDSVIKQNPAFILDSGDMIYGHTSDTNRIREQWRLYQQAIGRVHPHIFHVPGNHDIWDEQSVQIYRQLWGSTYFAFVYGNCRFIGLDTETDNGQLGEQQFHWLQQQLEQAAERHVFLFFHRPVFPLDAEAGSSLDASQAERDRIHQLLRKHRPKIRGVFAGHEHLYSYQQRDGVPYYISGGAGAPLYTAPELGGFHHYLVVHVAGDRVTVQLKKVAAPTRKLEPPQRVLGGQVLETWDQGLIWYAWDRTANIELTPERASQGRRGLRLNFDLNQYAWPVLVLPLATAWDLQQYDSVSIDVFVPAHLRGVFQIAAAVQADSKTEAPAQILKPGWNTVTSDLKQSSSQLNKPIESLEWDLSCDGSKTSGYFVFDNFRATRKNSPRSGTRLLEGFERPLLWRAFDETVRAEILQPNSDGAPNGLKVSLDFAKCKRPEVFAQLNPPWDLTKVDSLVLKCSSTNAPLADLGIELCLRAKDVEYRSPVLPLSAGTTLTQFGLAKDWLPPAARAAVEQVGFTFVSTNGTGMSEVRLEKLSCGKS